jgi:hypothetical protein
MSDFEKLMLIPVLLVLSAVLLEQYAKLPDHLQRAGNTIAWAVAVLAITVGAGVAAFVLLTETEAQDAPVVVVVSPVVVPELTCWDYIEADAAEWGLLRALRIALGHGDNEDGCIDAVLVFDLGIDRPVAELLSRLTFRLLFGDPADDIEGAHNLV